MDNKLTLHFWKNTVTINWKYQMGLFHKCVFLNAQCD